MLIFSSLLTSSRASSVANPAGKDSGRWSCALVYNEQTQIRLEKLCLCLNPLRAISKLEAQVKQLEHENQARARYAFHSNAQPSGAG